MNCLSRLGESQEQIHAMITRENFTISAEKEEVLAELWTYLGGNKRRLRTMDDHLDLLRNIGAYRKLAQARIIVAMQTLHSLREDLEDLRQRTAAPELVGEKIPVEVHLMSIQLSMERMKQKRVQAQQIQSNAMNMLFIAAE